jgi:hypothetical protein
MKLKSSRNVTDDLKSNALNALGQFVRLLAVTHTPS